MYEITRTYEFAAAHRIEGHPKCGRMHGHNYIVEVVLASHRLQNGMVLDFAALDRMVKPIIEEMDHKYLMTTVEESGFGVDYVSEGERYHLETGFSTAERIAEHIFEKLFEQLGLVKEVSIWETLKSKATYRRG